VASTAGSPAPRFVRGWGVVAGVFALMAIASGFAFYNASVYLSAVVSERGINLTVASGASAAFFVTAGVAGVPISRWVTARDPRQVILAGAAAGGLSLLALGRATSAWQLYATFIVFGLSFAAISFVPGTTLITRWFTRRRALALTLATTGLSVGGIVITPATAAAIERTDLAAVAPVLAALWFGGVVLVVICAIRPSPQALGLSPDGDAPPTEGAADPGGVVARTAYRTWTFRWLVIGTTALLLTQVGVLAHLYPLVIDRGDAALASLAVSVVAGGSIAGRFLGILVLRRLDALWFIVWLAAAQVLSLVALATGGGAVAVLIATAAFGMTVGNLLILIPLVIVETFGMRDYPRIYAMTQLVGAFGIALGPLVLGALRDTLGSYVPGTFTAAGVSLVASGILVAAARARVDEGFARPAT
jgi:cyanate permease